MIDSLLIANRGEIACRVIRTCKRLGIRTIAVHSDADKEARHVLEADDTVRIGPADATSSYLNADLIIQAALASGAAAIHPGYGFLAEKTILPELCKKNNLIWVGPKAEVIALMGSKIESKRIAEAAGVAAVPGYHGEDQSELHLLEKAREIGFPVLIKASAGGGGKGMRRVDTAAEFLTQLATAKQEAVRAFGDDRVLIEKLITRPRHLEVQLLGDQHGNLIHLFERECSIQRNYQKIIEEAPAAYLTEDVRACLFDYALRLGNEIHYDSLGTVEFVLDATTNLPYFLEMNTRLQVEHPVTEMVTGLDLIELQLLAASGAPLPIAQADVRVHGWAIEARINAEDPAKDYQPQIGQITQYSEPDLVGVRVESGIQAGSLVTPHYDSMIAKLIGYGLTRKLAVRRLTDGLANFNVQGVGTNQAFLRDIVRRPAFTAAPLTTLYMGEEYPDGWKADACLYQLAMAAGAWHALFAVQAPDIQTSFPWQRADGWRNMAGDQGVAAATVELRVDGGDPCTIDVIRGHKNVQFNIAGQMVTLHVNRLSNMELRLSGDDLKPMDFNVSKEGAHIVVARLGLRWKMTISSALESLAKTASAESEQAGAIASPMPGLITGINVSVGQTVKTAEVVLIMEAMKLIYPMESLIDGVVTAIHCAVGDTVASGVPLVDIEAAADA